MPVQRVSAVVGVLVLEASDIDEIIRAERVALVPFIGVAVLMAFITSVMLTLGIARPLRRLALAADRIRSGASDKIDVPLLTQRTDEIGDLATSIQSMTEALLERIDVKSRDQLMDAAYDDQIYVDDRTIDRHHPFGYIGRSAEQMGHCGHQ